MANAPKTIAQRKQETQGKPAFQVQTTMATGPYKVGDYLSKDRDIAAYFRDVVNAGKDEADYTKLTDEQIVAGVKHVNVEGLSNDDAEIARAEYLEGLTSHPAIHADVPAIIGSGLSVLDNVAKKARALGEKADDALLTAVDKAVEGKKDWASAPLFLERELIRVYGEQGLAEFPPIGSRRQGLKSDTIPAGMTAEQWQNGNSPVDFYKEGETKGRFVTQWFAGTVTGSPLQRDILQLRALTTKDSAPLPETPEEWLELKDTNYRTLESILHAKQGEWNDAISRIALAVKFWQRKQEMAEKLPKVGIVLVGISYTEAGEETGHEFAIRLREPIALRDKSSPNSDAHTTGKPMTLNKFFLLKVDVAAKTGATVSALMKTVERKPKQPGGSTPDVKPTRITSPAALGDAMVLAFNFLDGDDARTLIMGAISKPGGAVLASRICYLSDNLKGYANDPDVRRIAEAYDRTQMSATAAAMDAKTKEANAKVENKAAA